MFFPTFFVSLSNKTVSTCRSCIVLIICLHSSGMFSYRTSKHNQVALLLYVVHEDVIHEGLASIDHDHVVEIGFCIVLSQSLYSYIVNIQLYSHYTAI